MSLVNNDQMGMRSDMPPLQLLSTGHGLDRSYTAMRLDEFIKARQNRNFEIAIAVVVVIGVAIAVASVALSIFVLMGPVASPILLANILSVANVSTVGLIPGCGSGFGLFGLSLLISQVIMPYFDGFEKYCEDFKAEGSDGRETPSPDIKYILNKVNGATRQDLIDQMNFEQLSVARQALGNITFKRYLDAGTKIGHVAWKGIYQLGECKNREEFSTKIKNRVFSKYIEEPSFKAALLDYLKTLNNYNEFKDIVQPALPVPRGPEHAFNIGDQTVKISEALYNEYCEGALRHDLDKFLKGESLELVEYEDETELKNSLVLYLKYIGAQIQDWNKHTLTSLVDFCHRRWQTKLLSKLDGVLLENRHLFSDQDLLKWSTDIKEFVKLRELTAKIMHQNPVNDQNWLQVYEYQAAVNSPVLREKCSSYAITALKMSSHQGEVEKCATWIQRCKDTLRSEAFEQLMATIKNELKVLDIQSWDLLWQFAQKSGIAQFKKVCSEVAFSNFINFQERNPGEWLTRSMDAGVIADLRLLIKQVHPNVNTLKLLYDAVEKTKKGLSEDKAEVLNLLKQACLAFCLDHKEDPDKKIYTLWPLFEVPTEVAEILY